MQIAEMLTVNGKTIAVCTGKDITPDTKCSKFEHRGKTYETLGSSVSNSFTDRLQLFLLLPNDTEVSRGNIKIIT